MASVPILGIAGPWLPPVRAGQRGLAVFLFHDVTDKPSPYSLQVRTCTDPSLFVRQLAWIRHRFTILHPLQIERGEIPPRSALLTFDDGFLSFRKVALPLLESENLPAVVFLNMDVVEGSPNAAALTAWSCRGNLYGQALWEESRPQKYEPTLQFLQNSGERSAFQEFQGRFLDEADVAALDGHPLVTFGSHLSNHWYGPSLNGREFDEALKTNHRRLQAYQHGMPWLAYPFGVGTPHLDERAESYGVTRVFTGRGLLNSEPSQKVLHRVDLNGEIRNRLLFRWRLSTRTALAGLRRLAG
jgi:peptidoglycan/xylan/chitin deacetylase (PgdA/CDA1 family)